MKQIILIAGLTLFISSIVGAQTTTNDSPTRQQTLQKGKVLRKKATVKPAYYVNGGTRLDKVPKHPQTDGSPRTQPMITKPLIPPQPN